jgi:type III restriction enzyme
VPFEYVPDFVVEAETRNYLVETKARGDMKDAEVLAKAEAATRWCRHATEYAVGNGGKPWHFLLVPHDEIEESRYLRDFERYKRS